MIQTSFNKITSVLTVSVHTEEVFRFLIILVIDCILILSPEKARTNAPIAEGTTKIALATLPLFVLGASLKAVPIRKTMPEYATIP